MNAFALTKELGEIADFLTERALSGLDLPVIETAIIAARLKLVTNLSRSIEQELDVHRLTEAGQRGREIANAAASEMLAEMVRDPDGKVIRPDFGGRER